MLDSNGWMENDFNFDSWESFMNCFMKIRLIHRSLEFHSSLLRLYESNDHSSISISFNTLLSAQRWMESNPCHTVCKALFSRKAKIVTFQLISDDLRAFLSPWSTKFAFSQYSRCCLCAKIKGLFKEFVFPTKNSKHKSWCLTSWDKIWSDSIAREKRRVNEEDAVNCLRAKNIPWNDLVVSRRD